VAAAASAANPDAEEAKPAAVGTAFVESTFAKSPSISPYSLIKSRYLVTRLYASPVTSSLSKVHLSSVIFLLIFIVFFVLKLFIIIYILLYFCIINLLIHICHLFIITTYITQFYLYILYLFIIFIS